MDQVKESLAVAIKHGFWIGSSLVLIGTLAVWYLSTGDLDKQIDDQIRGIKSDVQKVSQYDMELPTQPNDLSHKWMNDKIEVRKEEVLTAWQRVFDAQRDILTWPDILKDEFLDEFKYVKDPDTGVVDKTKLKLPFEKYELFGDSNTDKVVPMLLRRYEKYIGLVLPQYAEICGAKWTADFESRRGVGGGMSGSMSGSMGGDDYNMEAMMMGPGGRNRAKVDITGASDEPVVIWSKGAQDALLKDLFPWRGVKEYPSELDVYYSQENLWILQQLLEIVATVNGNAQQAFEAEIREIKKLSIGRSVTFNQGTISDPGSKARGGFGGMGGYGYGGMDGDMQMEMNDVYEMGGDFRSTSEELGPDPGEERYVNTAFEPISASSLRGAFTSNDPGQVAIAVAKRLPVMMTLQMDQRSIPKLLAACESAPLMVDVHQVRIMPKGGSSSGGMGGMGGMDDMGGMSMEDEMMGGMGGYGGPGGGGGGGGGAIKPPEEFPMDMDVEIYGLIYFFNPPSEESLGVEKVEGDVSIDESAEVVDALPGPATTPADTTPPAATTPAETTPPAATQPAGPTADPTQPAGPTQPAATQPAAPTQPAPTQPAPTQPAATPPAAPTPPAAAPPAGNSNGTAAAPPAAIATPALLP